MQILVLRMINNPRTVVMATVWPWNSDTHNLKAAKSPGKLLLPKSC